MSAEVQNFNAGYFCLADLYISSDNYNSVLRCMGAKRAVPWTAPQTDCFSQSERSGLASKMLEGNRLE